MEVTLLTENTRVRYTGDGVLKEFSYPFNPIDLSYVKVYKNLQPVTAPDVTISSGVVTFNTAPAEGDSIVIIREKPLTYDSGIVSKGIISPDSLDNLAVELLGQIQQVNEKLDRVPVYPIDTAMTGEDIINEFNQDVQTVKDSRVEVEGKAEEINNAVSSGLTEINNTTSESKSQITEEKNTSISEIQRVTEGLIDRAEVAADESESWANKAESFANQANLDSIRTNCLTVIPEDIKLELADGVLTLKAGSKVYYLDGSSKIIQQDITTSVVSATSAQRFLWVSGDSSFGDGSTLECYSGNNEAMNTIANPKSYQTFYNTEQKKAFRGNNTNWEERDYSLPIALMSNEPNVWTSIDQVFNGAGYIGGYIFGTNMEGKAANGNNQDGTINNVTIKLDSFQGVQDPDTNRSKILLLADGKFRLGNLWFEQEKRPNFIENSNQFWYNPKTRKTFYYRSTTNNGYVQTALIATYNIDSNGQIYNWKMKPTFQAADYQDVPKLATDNTFTGKNTFTKSTTFAQPITIHKNGRAVDIRASNGSLAGSLNALSNNLNSKEVSLYCFDAAGAQNAYLALYYNNGSPFAAFSNNYTLANGDSSKKVATTDWAAGLRKSNTFTAANTFTGPIYMNLANDARIRTYAPNLTHGTAPASTQWAGIDLQDKNGVEMAECICFVDSNNKACAAQWVRSPKAGDNKTTFGVVTEAYADGTFATRALTPALNSNDTKIVTTNWFNQKIQVVSSLPASPNGNVFYFVTG